jgi:hypothetical protein
MTLQKVDPQSFYPLRNVHSKDKCVGTGCALHHPGRHPLNTNTLYWDNNTKMMFRQCAHSRMHPDVDSVERRVYHGEKREVVAAHGCCTYECCRWSSYYKDLGWHVLGPADSRTHAMQVIEALGIKRNDWRWDGISGEIMVYYPSSI